MTSDRVSENEVSASGHFEAGEKIKPLADIDPDGQRADLCFALFLVAFAKEAEAGTVWWLAREQAEGVSQRISYRTIVRDLRVQRDAYAYSRSLQGLHADGLLTAKASPNRFTEVRLLSDVLLNKVASTVPTALRLAPPDAVVCGLPAPTAFARLCMLLRSREQTILLSWLYQAGAATAPVLLTTRALEAALMGLVDRRTAMRTMQRLAVAGLVSIEPKGRAGSTYALNDVALSQLLHSFPFPAEAVHTLPGWSVRPFPLMQRVAELLAAQADAEVADVAAPSVPTGADAGVRAPTAHAGAEEFSRDPKAAAGSAVAAISSEV